MAFFGIYILPAAKRVGWTLPRQKWRKLLMVD